MNKIKKIVVVAALLAAGNIWSYGTGWSSYPLLSGKKLISTELTGVTSTGGGLGMQARLTSKINKKLTADAGLGISGGEREARLFVGFDYELYPDYGTQPKISMKTTIENSKEFGVRRNVFSLAPTVSKGFSLWGHEAFPYISTPFGISLDSESKTYESMISANLGINGNIPVEGYRHLQASAELQIGLKDSFTGILLGLSYPLN